MISIRSRSRMLQHHLVSKRHQLQDQVQLKFLNSYSRPVVRGQALGIGNCYNFFDFHNVLYHIWIMPKWAIPNMLMRKFYWNILEFPGLNFVWNCFGHAAKVTGIGQTSLKTFFVVVVASFCFVLLFVFVCLFCFVLFLYFCFVFVFFFVFLILILFHFLNITCRFFKKDQGTRSRSKYWMSKKSVGHRISHWH